MNSGNGPLMPAYPVPVPDPWNTPQTPAAGPPAPVAYGHGFGYGQSHLPAVGALHAYHGGGDDDGPEPRKILTLRLLNRTLKRYWWQILLLWIAACGSLMALAYTQIKPVYHAFAQIEVKPGEPGLYAAKMLLDNETNIQTQVQLITNTRVLSAVVAENPEMANFPSMKNSTDLEAEIRKNLKVMHMPKTSLMQVGMSSENPVEAASVINAVVKAFVKMHETWTEQETKTHVERFSKLVGASKAEVERKRAEVQRIANQLVGGNDLDLVKDQNKMSLERFNKLKDELNQTRMDRAMSEADLDRMRANLGVSLPANAAISEEEIQSELRSDPNLMYLSQETAKAKRAWDETKRLSRDPRDPTRDKAEQRYNDLADELDRQTMARIVSLRRRNTVINNNTEETRELRKVEREIDQLKAKESVLDDRLKVINLDKENAGDNTTKLIFARTDLNREESNLEMLEKRLKQYEQDAKTPSAIQVRSEAKPNGNNRTDQRLRVMALIPIACGTLVVGLFLLLEIRAGRVADPEELPDRVRLPVIGIVPPLPALAASRGGAVSTKNQIRSQRQIDVFVQCLDHLRVVLCSGQGIGPGQRPGDPARRCVLITSAVGSEGKTTLAAQLAGRCANAGLLTLLIDADLRNPSLSWMLDVEEGAGLSDVLRGDIEAESIIKHIGDAGGFHLLPAGPPQADPSRLLQGERLGQLLQRFRATFDIVIVDAPPVLPVPDALITARWTDGAILAVRHETSRYSLVERARQRLAGIGVPVLGAVVNGVRSAETSYGYGGYGYGYGAGASANASNGHHAGGAAAAKAGAGQVQPEEIY